jgi:anti-sigma regulatory factor (Ser/Thr protein kinase)
MTIGAPADRGAVARVNAAFAEFAERHALPGAVRRSVHVVLDELLTNAIVHGFGGGQDGGEVTVDVVVRPDRVAVTVTDDGPPFNPLEVPAPDVTRAAKDRPMGGLGIPLVRQMMDEVRYERRAGRNVVTLAKLLIGGR